MATIILQAVGSAVGGPIGAVIGSMVGQAIDASLFGPKARQGPRLGDLAVQTSSYGTAIPKLFGTLRAAGTVIWSTDLQERRSTSGGGKGRPKTIEYSYSASFAVALSGRPIRGVRRIWADGKLLRGAAGDFKTPTGFRLYHGNEDQPVDPLIASAEGAGNSPAYRGIAYAMFEDFELADYGNRIPSLTFEIEADAGPVAIGGIAEALSQGAVAGAPLAEPPATPAIGECWLVAASATGTWAGRSGSLAAWTSGGWRFVPPQHGMCVWDKAAGVARRWTGSGWNAGEVVAAKIVIAGQQVVGPRQPQVPSPSGGTIIDVEARASIEAITVALKSHGLID